MFLEILQTLIKVLMVFSILIIAFGLAFYIVLSKSKVIQLDFQTRSGLDDIILLFVLFLNRPRRHICHRVNWLSPIFQCRWCERFQ